MREQFLDIYGYEGMYQISNKGNVISLEREKQGKGNSSYPTKTTILKPQVNKFGYVSVMLTDDLSSMKKIDIHRLVGLHFIPNPDNKEQLNHIDGDKSNNDVTNLEWVTRQENMKHATEMGLMAYGERHGMSRLTNDEVVSMRKELSIGINRKFLANKYNTTPGNVYKIEHGLRWTKV